MYDRAGGEVAANHDGFEAHHDILQDTKPREGIYPYTTNPAGNPIRYSTERSEAFARYEFFSNLKHICTTSIIYVCVILGLINIVILYFCT